MSPGAQPPSNRASPKAGLVMPLIRPATKVGCHGSLTTYGEPQGSPKTKLRFAGRYETSEHACALRHRRAACSISLWHLRCGSRLLLQPSAQSLMKHARETRCSTRGFELRSPLTTDLRVALAFDHRPARQRARQTTPTLTPLQPPSPLSLP
eukprot:1685049-Rhodomonas_salina.3